MAPANTKDRGRVKEKKRKVADGLDVKEEDQSKNKKIKKEKKGHDTNDNYSKQKKQDDIQDDKSKIKKDKGQTEKRSSKRKKTPELISDNDEKVQNQENGVTKKEAQSTEKGKQKKGNVKSESVPRPPKYESLGDGPAPVPVTGKKYMGCHVSAAGGVWFAFDNSKECKAKSFGVFLRNQRQWLAKALDDTTIKKWKEVMEVSETSPHLILPHGSYLMNLGSPDEEVLKKSRNMLLEELQRCQSLGIPHYNFHPGSTVGKRSREDCCKQIAESINLAHKQTQGVICVLENMSCQGNTVGGDFHELRLIIEHVVDKTRVGVCLDTCHAHAAGYDLSTQAGFDELMDDFGKIIGWQFLRGLHINDSKGKPGDHLDRHENIGRGTIGIEGFRRIMNCDRFNDIPLILETPWTSNDGYAKEIKKLEGLIK